MAQNKSFVAETWDFLRMRRAWWLVPTLVMLTLLGSLVLFGQSSAVPQYLYALF